MGDVAMSQPGSPNGKHNGHSDRTRVLVLFGGQSGEHDVSLRSAQTVMRALDHSRYDIVQVGITRDGHWLTGGDPMAALTAESPLFQLGPNAAGNRAEVPVASEPTEALPAVMSGHVDVVFPVLHGPMGEDGTVQGLLELSGIPYVGSGVAMDKAIAKSILAQAGIPQGPWMLVLRRDWERDPVAITTRVATEFG